MTECLVFDYIALTFTYQNFMLMNSRSVIDPYTNSSPIPPMVLLVSSSQNSWVCSFSHILRLLSSSLVRTDASQTGWGSHSVSTVVIMWVYYVISSWVGTIQSKYTVVSSVLKGMKTVLQSNINFLFSTNGSLETVIPIILIWFGLMIEWSMLNPNQRT